MSCFKNIGGMLPTSMLDWPGEICTVIFLYGCNFRCPYCHNPELVEGKQPDEPLDWEEVASYLRQRAGWIDGVSITGGEPTLHQDLRRMCEEISRMGMKVKLDTNGSRPERLEDLLDEGMLDFVAMDVKTSFDKYHLVAGRDIDAGKISRSIRSILDSGVEHEFRCTVVPGLVDLDDLRHIAEMLQGARCLILQQFRSGKTLDPSYEDKERYPEETLLEWCDTLSHSVPTKIRGLSGVY